MKMKTAGIFSKINDKYKKYILILVILIFIISTFLSILALRQPLQIEEKIISNTIEEKTSFNYEAIVKQSTLYPKGGRVATDKVIFNNLTEDFIIELNSEINTDKTVRVEAEKEITYIIVAEKMWEREFLLKGQESTNTEGTSHNIMNDEVYINLNGINDFIAKIEEETLVRPSYSMIVKSIITGYVYDEENNIIYEINNLLEIPFSLSGQYISYAGETEQKEFINTKTIEKINIVPQYFNLFGSNFLIIPSRITFITTATISLILIILFLREINKQKKVNLTEANLIDKKNKGKIVRISNKIDFENLFCINMRNFKDLIKVAEEKDESIFKYEDSNLGITYYYIISSNFIYLFKCITFIKESGQVQDA